MSELNSNGQYASRVRIEITTNDGVTYEVELEDCAKADLDIDRDTMELPGAGIGGWARTIGPDSATVTLTARGKVVKAERRGR